MAVMRPPIVAGILLAAGRGTRFGGNKLEADFRGGMLGLHAARTLAGLNLHHLIAVHDPERAKLAKALLDEGFTLCAPKAPTAGQGQSIALAAQAALETDATAMLVSLADMPFVTPDHFRAVIRAGGDHIVASALGANRLPPALFPRRLFPALACLSGDMGASALLKNAVLVSGDAAMLADIDTRADFDRMA
jgi:molybdenum cofactor cytidylyltransferase